MSYREVSELPNIQRSFNQALGTVAGIAKDYPANTDMQTKAMSRVKIQAEAKATQRRNFKDYLAKMPTNFGGTVGQLNPEMQKQIAKQYSPSERKRIMDRMDREAENGKKQRKTD